MSTALLDVNVLVALFDQSHIHHESAHDWLAASSATMGDLSHYDQRLHPRIESPELPDGSRHAR